MAETEYRDPDRVKLLTALKEALNCNVSSTIWAFLWLSDIDKLRKLVDDAQKDKFSVHSIFWAIDNGGKIVQKCRFINSYLLTV
jgi:hypothetical protein